MKKPLTENKTTNKIMLWVYHNDKSRSRELEPWPTSMLKGKLLHFKSNSIMGIELTLRQIENLV